MSENEVETDKTQVETNKPEIKAKQKTMKN